MESHERGSLADLVRYRITTAKSDLQSACILMKEGEYRGANNRAYYAIYHAVSEQYAALAKGTVLKMIDGKRNLF